MTESAVYLQPAFILQHRPYRESSILLEVFTRDYGIVSILARGVRKEKSKMAGLLLPFSLLHLSYLDKNELKILTQAEYGSSYPLQRLALYCGFYVNELLRKFLHNHDPHPRLFLRYQTCLRDLSDGAAIEQTLRYFELDLLEQAGYATQLDVDQSGNRIVESRRRYRFLPGSGMVEDSLGHVSGATLLALSIKAALVGPALPEAKQLLRNMLDEHLQGRPLKSRDVLAKIIRYL
ncbi:DNA repair protein RecO [Methylomonas sp. LL1]|uniref:DNA repair protein RecO n=1 Tax=Methylomonas sp. LL1 TaxID=2785785 RepID=UPI0018C3AD18|nr:DNA repair protein RecO [Methylomonas sp. LL1]QPK61546.1 DNA repair protein RecO [Methylomonas sp. LL1]